MGNVGSTDTGQHQPHPLRPADFQSNPKREHAPASSDGRHITRIVAPQSSQQQRIVVDIRSTDLDKDHARSRESNSDLENVLRSAWGGLQALGGVVITILTIQKLWEDIIFVRLLQRELSKLVGSLVDPGGDALVDDGDEGGERLPPTLPPPSPPPHTPLMMTTWSGAWRN
ncbi:hypothetical protein Agub_g12483 [Astrephomene gubernaculifera]|uniref:Uncharacterized protein n=1 Tax=Astrephomene gubernaculifera TaxID=47775 RepID=A0AAD3DYR2_9CHLO|nr:hypothetical protein Agub_g12483 [Astrephomene gubernaculifera]